MLYEIKFSARGLGLWASVSANEIEYSIMPLVINRNLQTIL
jgi:hypothetical protein